MQISFEPLIRSLEAISPVERFGYVAAIESGHIGISGLVRHASVGDPIEICNAAGRVWGGEIVAMTDERAIAMTYESPDGIAIHTPVRLKRRSEASPTPAWIGRIVDAFGRPIDGMPLFDGQRTSRLQAAPPDPAKRKGLGARLRTGHAIFDTVLPIVKGQRLGVFAGSGVGKSTLLSELTKHVEADVVVFALIGERGRELREFTEKTLGKEGRARSVIVAATSDQSPLIKRRAAWMAMAIAETFRDEGKHVLLLMDSVTRFAEAHREVALTAGEQASLRGFPPSTANLIASLAERAGPGLEDGGGDITAIFSVLVAGSDMEEPIADITRGVLDGHIVLTRGIAERGRFPAVDVRQSVSRSLPDAASPEENEKIGKVRRLLAVYEDAEPMIQTGLYVDGSDARIDEAKQLWPALDAFISLRVSEGVDASFAALDRSMSGEEDLA